MTRTDAAVASTGRARRPAGPTGLDGTTVFTVYLFALLLIPSNQTITVMGSLGVPGMLIRRLLRSSMRGRSFSIIGARRRRMPTFTRILGSVA